MSQISKLVIGAAVVPSDVSALRFQAEAVDDWEKDAANFFETVNNNKIEATQGGDIFNLAKESYEKNTMTTLKLTQQNFDNVYPKLKEAWGEELSEDERKMLVSSFFNKWSNDFDGCKGNEKYVDIRQKRALEDFKNFGLLDKIRDLSEEDTIKQEVELLFTYMVTAYTGGNGWEGQADQTTFEDFKLLYDMGQSDKFSAFGRAKIYWNPDLTLDQYLEFTELNSRLGGYFDKDGANGAHTDYAGAFSAFDKDQKIKDTGRVHGIIIDFLEAKSMSVGDLMINDSLTAEQYRAGLDTWWCEVEDSNVFLSCLFKWRLLMSYIVVFVVIVGVILGYVCQSGSTETQHEQS